MTPHQYSFLETILASIEVLVKIVSWKPFAVFDILREKIPKEIVDVPRPD